MSITTYPLNKIEYTAEDASLYNCTRTSGVYAGDDFTATVTGTDNTITVGAGIAWMRLSKFRGVVVALKEDETVEMGLPDAVYPRIDHVVLQYDANKNSVELVVKEGTPASNPVPPERLTSDIAYEIHLYRVRREAGASVVTSANVTDLRLNSSYCGLMVDAVSKIDTSVFDAQFNELISQLENEISMVKAGSAYLFKSGDTMTGNLGMGGNRITGVGTPISENDAATKKYVDNSSPKIEILWENEASYNEIHFESQTISVDWSEYKFLHLQFVSYASSGKHLFDDIRIATLLNGNYRATRDTQVSVGDSYEERTYVREFELVDGGIYFDNAYPLSGSSSLNLPANQYLKPYRIYGVTGENTSSPEYVEQDLSIGFITEEADSNNMEYGQSFSVIDNITVDGHTINYNLHHYKLPEKESSDGNANGLTAEQITALDAMFKVCAYIKDDVSAEYEDFRAAFGLEDITHAISSVLTNVTNNNALTSVEDRASYSAILTADDGYVLDAVTVTMGGEDITATAYSGGVVSISVVTGDVVITATAVVSEAPVVTYTVTNNLTNVTSSNSASSIQEGNTYTATLTAEDGYTLEGAEITVVVNGVDVTDTAYADGVITIQSVIGNVVITATAVEEGAADGGEVTMLKNISFDGTSYLDTEFIPQDISNRYVFGIQTVDDYAANNEVKYFAGVSMRDNTNLANANYYDLLFYTTIKDNSYNTERQREEIWTSIASTTAYVCVGQDSGNNAATQVYLEPMYVSVADGAQGLWKDEDLTVAPTTGNFAKLTNTASFSSSTYYDESKVPIKPMWLGKVNVTGVMTSYSNAPYAGVKFYCFKVYDAEDNLIVNMRPAKQGSKIGMFDTVRNKFYPATENGGVVNYEEAA